MSWLPYAVAAWLFLIGLYGIVTSRNLVHLVVCLSVLQSSTYLMLLSIGYRANGVAPFFQDTAPTARAVDPIVQALTLVDIVVGATVTGLLLALAVQTYNRTGTLDPEQLAPMRG